MIKEGQAFKILNLIIKKDNITISTDKIQEEVRKIMKSKEKIIMVILIKEMKDQITISMLKE
jgi:hypothetical protein